MKCFLKTKFFWTRGFFPRLCYVQKKADSTNKWEEKFCFSKCNRY